MSVLQDAPGTPGTVATGTTEVGQGDTPAQVSDKTPWTMLSNSVPLSLSPVPSLETEAHLQPQKPGFRVVHRSPLSPLKDQGGGSQYQDPPETTEGNSGLQIDEKWGVALPGSPRSGHDGSHGPAGLTAAAAG